MLAESIYNTSYSKGNIYGAWEQSVWIIKLKDQVEDKFTVKILVCGRKITFQMARTL